MPVHDWTRVDVGVFHDFHSSWIAHVKAALNGGLLPAGYYVQAAYRGMPAYWRGVIEGPRTGA
jgi:hypothetical protein